MTESLYDFFRGASGLSMMVIGLGYFLEPEHQRIRLSIGTFHVAAGTAFVLSWTSGFGLMPLALDNLLVIGIVFAGSLALFDIQLYLFGDEARRGMRRMVYLAAAVWSALLWVLPFFDGIVGLPVLTYSIEDGRPVALFQSITLSGMYALPIMVGAVSLRMGRWKLSDIPPRSCQVRSLVIMLMLMVSALVLSSVAFVARSVFFYRMGQVLLQALILGCYLYFKAVPEVLQMARKEIGREHKKKTQLDPGEVAVIQEKMRRLETVEHIHTNARLEPASLARTLEIPVYRLTLFMTLYRGTSFAEWLHAARIDHARIMLADGSDPDIDAVGRAVGYSSLTIFRSQFLKRVGLAPEAYRARNQGAAERSRRKAPERV